MSALIAFGPSIWLADGDQVQVAGFRYPTRATVAALPNGELLVWSPVALAPDLKASIDALGRVSAVVAPNALHHLSVRAWLDAYPQARLYGAPGLTRRSGLIPDRTLDDASPPEWGADFDVVLLRGNAIAVEAVLFHRPSRTAVFTDLLQQFPPNWFSGWRALAARLDLMTGPEPAVPRKFRIAFRDRTTARADLARIRSWPVEKVVMAHGRPVESDGGVFLARAFGWLTRSG